MTEKNRKIWVAGNWKMNSTAAESVAMLRALFNLLTNVSKELQVAVFPPVLSLEKSLEVAKKNIAASANRLSLQVGSQNTHGETIGSFTGEVSVPMLKEIGISLSLVGHSERRQYFGETDASARKRTEGLLAQGFTVIHCIGETKAERDAGKTFQVLERQIYDGLPEAENDRLVIAYEPVWAIGTGVTATPEQAEEAHAEVRRLLSKRYGEERSRKISILYGGSINPENFESLLALPNVDGGLIGGASLKADSFAKLIQIGQKSFASHA